MKKMLMIALLTLAIGLPAMGGQVVSGTFNGQTASPLTICCGFIPDYVNVYNIENAGTPRVVWSVNNRSVEFLEGMLSTGVAIRVSSALTTGNGISIYRGGDVLSSTTCTNYLIRDADDKRSSGTGDAVDTWTIDTNSTYHGHFNATPSSTYVGEGSRVNIDGKWYNMVSMGGDATVKGSVGLDEAAPSGNVNAIRPMYDYKVASSGDIAPAGFIIAATACNVSGDICFFEAGTYDEK